MVTEPNPNPTQGSAGVGDAVTQQALLGAARRSGRSGLATCQIEMAAEAQANPWVSRPLKPAIWGSGRTTLPCEPFPYTGPQGGHFPCGVVVCRTSVNHIWVMCGRVIQSSAPIRYAIVDGMNVRDSRVANYPPRWNGAPSQDLLVIRRNHKTGEVSLDPLRWGLIPYWCEDPKGGRKPINAKCETVRTLPSFREAYRKRRCILPVDGFFEWKAIKGQKAKQPYAIAMKDGSPFGIGGLWENWRDPTSGEWVRTFAIITTDANELVAEIHDRMPLILASGDCTRWLSDEPNPRDLMRPFPAEPMRMWPISTRVNKPENDDPSIVQRGAFDSPALGRRFLPHTAAVTCPSTDASALCIRLGAPRLHGRGFFWLPVAGIIKNFGAAPARKCSATRGRAAGAAVPETFAGDVATNRGGFIWPFRPRRRR